MASSREQALEHVFPDMPRPIKKQKTLNFTPVAPEKKQEQLQAEIESFRKAKEDEKSDKSEAEQRAAAISNLWGLPWPRPAQTGQRRKGGPIPRAEKWENGLYEWVGKISRGDLPAPAVKPPKEFPHDWDHRTTAVWHYAPKQPKNDMSNDITQAASSEGPEQKGVPADGHEDPLQATGGNVDPEPSRRPYHKYPQAVVDFYFQFERDMKGPRLQTVTFLKENYPSLFPLGFNEGRVRAWERNRKLQDTSQSADKDKTNTGAEGQGWRLGKTVLGVSHLAFIGSLILANYHAGVPMTAKLLVPLVAGALVAKGLDDKVFQ